MTAVRPFVRQLLRGLAPLRGSEYGPSDLQRSALVFSPHFDDETLGCGGVIIKKLQAGARVALVFMTDGSQSHRGLIDTARLRAFRAQEGFAAAAALGVPPDDVILLAFPELALANHYAQAVERALALLREYQPEHVFVPYASEPPLWSRDHQTTTRATLDALRHYGRPITIYEYPVWFWLHWPWVPIPLTRRSGARAVLVNSLRYGFGLRGVWDFNCWLYSGDVEAQKRYALAQHRSQMQPPPELAGWPTLGSVADGAFLRCFFQSHELFRRTSLPAA